MGNLVSRIGVRNNTTPSLRCGSPQVALGVDCCGALTCCGGCGSTASTDRNHLLRPLPLLCPVLLRAPLGCAGSSRLRRLLGTARSKPRPSRPESSPCSSPPCSAASGPTWCGLSTQRRRGKTRRLRFVSDDGGGVTTFRRGISADTVR
eukprot:SAG31_NODE_11905_length_987_cov_1.387387_1_plen_149_part_00